MIRKKRKKLDLILVLIWPILAALLTLAFKASFFLSTFLFIGVPAVYISFRHKKFIIKSLIFSVGSLPLLVILDYVAVSTGTWFFPKSIFAYRLFGTTTFEVLFWYSFYTYFIIIFYEYFLEEKCTPRLPTKSAKYLFSFLVLLFVIFAVKVLLSGSFIMIPYIYLILGIILCGIPILLVLYESPNLITKFTETTAYFFFFCLAWELVAVPLKQWTFPGKYFVGWVTLFGISFPFEEFFVWMVLSAAGLLAWYEFFDDDLK